MPGPRQPVRVLEANGRKHLTKQEKEDRLAAEVNVPPPKTVEPPAWLPKKFHGEFLTLGEALLKVGLYTDLDQDVLGQFLVSRERWVRADKLAAAAIRSKDEKLANEWSKVQATYFKQCRQCGEVLGLSVSSRCRLVLPPREDEPEDEFTAFLNRRRVSNE